MIILLFFFYLHGEAYLWFQISVWLLWIVCCWILSNIFVTCVLLLIIIHGVKHLIEIIRPIPIDILLSHLLKYAIIIHNVQIRIVKSTSLLIFLGLICNISFSFWFCKSFLKVFQFLNIEFASLVNFMIG